MASQAVKQAVTAMGSRVVMGITAQNSAVKAHVPAVFDMLSSAEGAFAELEQQTGDLLERLEPVLAPVPPVDSKLPTDNVAMSQVAMRIAQLTARILSLSQAVASTRSRIEI